MDKTIQVFGSYAVVSTETYGVKLTLSNVAVYGENVKLENLGYLFRGEQVVVTFHETPLSLF